MEASNFYQKVWRIWDSPAERKRRLGLREHLISEYGLNPSHINEAVNTLRIDAGRRSNKTSFALHALKWYKGVIVTSGMYVKTDILLQACRKEKYLPTQLPIPLGQVIRVLMSRKHAGVKRPGRTLIFIDEPRGMGTKALEEVYKLADPKTTEFIILGY